MRTSSCGLIIKFLSFDFPFNISKYILFKSINSGKPEDCNQQYIRKISSVNSCCYFNGEYQNLFKTVSRNRIGERDAGDCIYNLWLTQCEQDLIIGLIPEVVLTIAKQCTLALAS